MRQSSNTISEDPATSGLANCRISDKLVWFIENPHSSMREFVDGLRHHQTSIDTMSRVIQDPALKSILTTESPDVGFGGWFPELEPIFFWILGPFYKLDVREPLRAETPRGV